MGFLQSNSASLKTVQSSPLCVGEQIGEGSNHDVFSLGKTSEGVSIILKQGKNKTNTADIEYIHHQIALLNFLYARFPNRRTQLPKFYGLIRGISGRVGIVMDRFAGNYATNYRWNDSEVTTFQEELESHGLPKINADYIYPSLFHTIDGMRIGDLLTLSRQAIISLRPTDEQIRLHAVSKLLKRYPQLYSIESTYI